MGNNPSVRQFKTDMQDLVNKAKYNFHQELLAMADELVGNIRSAIEHSESHHLEQSVRKKDVSTSDETKLSVLILAGGPLTTKRGPAGSFDYALAEEFGTQKESPLPFFYSTYRFYKQAGLEQFRETLEETIEENNKVRGLRASNYSNSGANVSVGYRGAVVVGKGRL